MTNADDVAKHCPIRQNRESISFLSIRRRARSDRHPRPRSGKCASVARHRCRQLIGLSRKGRLAYMNPAPLECLSLAAVSPLFAQLKQFSFFPTRFTAHGSCCGTVCRSTMAYPNDRDEPGPSWRSRRLRRGSSTSSASLGTDESDDNSVMPWRFS